MARKIRLRYTGLIAFTSQAFSVFTGPAFLTFLTRNVTIEDFGIWEYIMLTISHIDFPHCLVNYWATRYIARRLKVAKTSLAANLTLSLAGFVTALQTITSVFLGAFVCFSVLLLIDKNTSS